MEKADLIHIGKLLRKKRKEQGLTQENLADEHISTSTISLIERGMPNVHWDKVEYYCKKMGLDLQKLITMEERQSEEEEKILLELLSIENAIELVDPQKALKRLKEIPDVYSDYVRNQIFYLKGKCYVKKQSWKKAIAQFVEAINLNEKNPDLRPTNILAASYFEISRCYFYQNNLEKSLEFADKALEVFEEQGQREYYKNIILISKAIYLERLDRIHESLEILNTLWKAIDKIENIMVVLNMYETKAILLMKLKMYDEAIEYANKTIILARINSMHERSLDAWTTLGKIYIEMGNYDEAELCLLTAIELIDNVQKEYLLINTFTQLGLLYFKINRLQEAIDSLNKAIEFCTKTNNKLRETQALISLSECYFKLNQIEKACEVLQNARKIAETYKFTNLLKPILLKLAQCYKSLNENIYRNLVEKLFELEISDINK